MHSNPLASLPLFQDLPEAATEALFYHSRMGEFAAGTILFCEGEPVECIHILLEGTVEIIKAIGSGHEQRIALRHAGDSLGEMSLYAPGQVRSASGRALGPVRSVQIAVEDMETLVRSHPHIALKLVREISRRMRDSESELVQELRLRNRALEQALVDLQAAQAQLVEQGKMEHELAMARDIQQSLLPKEIPSLPGWQIHAVWEPARAVSGDFYDFIPFPDGYLGLVIGDVTGKGVPAALVMAITRSVLHAVTDSVLESKQTSPGEILSRVNNILCIDMPPFMFVTCLLAILNPEDGNLRLANAGHVLPTQITPQGLRELRAIGLPLGLFPDQEFESITTQLRAHESLVFLSDGLIEAHNPQGEMYSSSRLKEQLSKYCAQTPIDGQKVIDSSLAELRSFTGEDWEQEDDLTIVTLLRY
jgi:serine phosphatase RsbU (regulator of sigma subunit)